MVYSANSFVSICLTEFWLLWAQFLFWCTTHINVRVLTRFEGLFNISKSPLDLVWVGVIASLSPALNAGHLDSDLKNKFLIGRSHWEMTLSFASSPPCFRSITTFFLQFFSLFHIAQGWLWLRLYIAVDLWEHTIDLNILSGNRLNKLLPTLFSGTILQVLFFLFGHSFSS